MISKEKIIETLKTIKDPEVDLDIWTMGLIYDLTFSDNEIDILMTYTTPFCPWGPQLRKDVEDSLKKDLGVEQVKVRVTFDPPYEMPENLRTLLGL